MHTTNDTRDEDDQVSLDQENAAYWRYRIRTSRALLCVALAMSVAFVFRNPLRWADGSAATALYYGSQVVLWIAVLVAYVGNARMAERRGLIRGRFRRSPTGKPTGTPPGRGPSMPS